MKFFLAQDQVLTCHPQAPSRWVSTVQARLSKADAGGLAITYTLEGELNRLCLPTQCAPSRVDGLWQHTCFEAFFSVQGSPAYREFNFAPSGQWAAYVFKNYRNGTPLSPDLNPRIKMRIFGNRLEIDALIREECLPPRQKNARLLMGLSAVIEEEGGFFSYWALGHPSTRPDFHHPDSFLLELNANNLDASSDPAYTGKR
jgi:hypothetical protein